MERINSRRELVELAKQLGVLADWHEPDEQGVGARIEGESFDNAGFWPTQPGRDWKGELCVVLCKDGQDVAVVNLASLFSMAVSPDGPLR
jgi:hypothetical protein